MAEPLSRFAGQEPKPRPTHTLIVPGREHVEGVIMVLLNAGECFTVEPMPDKVWHVGVFPSGAGLVTGLLQRE